MAKRIFILGKPGPDTYAMERNVKQALHEAGITRCTLRIVDEDDVTIKYGVGLFPVLVIDETVRAIGRVLQPGEVLNVLRLIGSYVPRAQNDADGWYERLD